MTALPTSSARAATASQPSQQAVSGIAGIANAWSVDTSDVGIMDNRICYVSIDDGAKEIARVRLDRDDCIQAAHLMAAAPIMLATLEKYADQLCEGWCEQSPDCANFDDCGGCEARRIAWKAKGENQ